MSHGSNIKPLSLILPVETIILQKKFPDCYLLDAIITTVVYYFVQLNKRMENKMAKYQIIIQM